MRVLEQLSPHRVFYYFENICAIPHGSGDTKQISDYCVEFAKAHGLWVRQDEWNNVVIRKPAAPGYEAHPPVMLQGHLDMVCEKDPDSPIDFATDPLDIAVEGDWVYARGTTLGGDDGVAVAMVLAILEDNALPHPAIEAVFTTDEETGMYGANGLDVSDIQSRLLINIDSEEEGILTVGCAGGARADIRLPLTKETNTAPCVTLTLDGLAGGHSGAEIHKGRQNANVMMGRLLKVLPADVRVVSIAGGQKDNAIPQRCVCVVATATDLSAHAATFVKQHRIDTDPGLTVTVIPTDKAVTAYDEASTHRIAGFLSEVENGIVAMSRHIEGLVETSLNLGVLTATDQELSATFAVRSSVGTEKEALLTRLSATAARFDGCMTTHGHYPAWEYREKSRLRDTMVAVYTAMTGQSPVVAAIHAGLECGLFSDKLPGLDAVSFGPDMQDIHTSRERLSISSTARTYDYLLRVLKAL